MVRWCFGLRSPRAFTPSHHHIIPRALAKSRYLADRTATFPPACLGVRLWSVRGRAPAEGHATNPPPQKPYGNPATVLGHEGHHGRRIVPQTRLIAGNAGKFPNMIHV